MGDGEPPIDWGISPGATLPHLDDPAAAPIDWGETVDVSEPSLAPASSRGGGGDDWPQRPKRLW